MMDLRSGSPFWPIRDGLPASYPALDRDIECDTVVVGGGLTGALIAHHLVLAGIDTVLVDRRDFGWGSTCATTALVLYDLDRGLVELSGMIGERRALEVYLACYGAVQRFGKLAASLSMEVGYAPRAGVWLASRKRDAFRLEEEASQRQRAGLPCELWGVRDIRARFPFRRAAALFTPEACRVDPYRLTHALIARGTQQGLRAFDRTAIVRTGRIRTRALHTGHRLVTDGGRAIAARRIVMATGYEALDELRLPKVRLYQTYALASEPLKEFPCWHLDALIWETVIPYCYLRSTEDGRVIIGGLDDVGIAPARRDRRLPDKARLLHRRFRALFPKVAFVPAFQWAGTFADASDSLPYVGQHPSRPGVWFALCFGGNGITFAQLAAEIIRDAFIDGPGAFRPLFSLTRAQ